MHHRANLIRVLIFSIASAISFATSMQSVHANEDPTEVAAAIADQKYSEHKMDVKRLFASRCSWCHQGYGMKQADGPRLAGTEKSRETVITIISKGKSPMPGFRKQLKPHQIEALAEYILALPPE